MKKVTSITTFNTDLGKMLALTYSEIDESGNIIKRNENMQKVVVDTETKNHIEALTLMAQSIVDSIETT